MSRLTLALAALIGAASVSACSATAAITPTTDTRQEIVTYDIAGIDYVSAADAVVSKTRSIMSSANIQRSFSPDPLPSEPGRLVLQNPLATTQMGPMAAFAANLQIPSCPNAQLIVSSDDNSFGNFGETTRYTTCLWEYEGGVHMAIYSAYTSRTGMNPTQLGRQAVQSMIGNSEQFIERSRQDVIEALEQAGATVTESSRRLS